MSQDIKKTSHFLRVDFPIEAPQQENFYEYSFMLRECPEGPYFGPEMKISFKVSQQINPDGSRFTTPGAPTIIAEDSTSKYMNQEAA